MTPQTPRRISTFARDTWPCYAPRTTALPGLVWNAPGCGRIGVLHGPNFNVFGRRDASIYGGFP